MCIFILLTWWNMEDKIIGKILVVDDEDEIRILLMRILEKEGHEVEQAFNGEECLKKIEEFQPDMILLDVNMPKLNGFDTMKKIREFNQFIPIIFVTANDQPSEIIKGLKSGANDYITKPFILGEIVARVGTHLRLQNMGQELKKTNKRLAELIEIDDLTGLYNMRSTYKRIEYELERGKRFKHSTGVIMLDMDNFKTVNDGHNHLFGSFVLSEMGKIILQSIRSVDFGARFGGDEFMVMLTVTNEKGLSIFCERLREDIEKTHFVNGEDKMFLTASLGYCLYSPDGPLLSPKEVVRIADDALYEAKNHGKNCVWGKNEIGDIIFSTQKEA